MSDKAPSSLLYEGFDPKFDHEVDHETGCFMKGAYTMPEVPWCFLYHDKDYHFWFYAEAMWDGTSYDVSVRDFSAQKFWRGGGPEPLIKIVDLPRIKRNMEKYFHERDFLRSSVPRKPGNVFRGVRFDWAPGVQGRLI